MDGFHDEIAMLMNDVMMRKLVKSNNRTK